MSRRPVAVTKFARDLDVTVVDDAPAALALFQAGARFDVILCDVMMPRMTGLELQAALRAVAPAQCDRIVFVTGGAVASAARMQLDELSNPRVEKPFDMHNLRALVREIVQRAP